MGLWAESHRYREGITHVGKTCMVFLVGKKREQDSRGSRCISR